MKATTACTTATVGRSTARRQSDDATRDGHPFGNGGGVLTAAALSPSPPPSPLDLTRVVYDSETGTRYFQPSDNLSPALAPEFLARANVVVVPGLAGLARLCASAGIPTALVSDASSEAVTAAAAVRALAALPGPDSVAVVTFEHGALLYDVARGRFYRIWIEFNQPAPAAFADADDFFSRFVVERERLLAGGADLLQDPEVLPVVRTLQSAARGVAGLRLGHDADVRYERIALPFGARPRSQHGQTDTSICRKGH